MRTKNKMDYNKAQTEFRTLLDLHGLIEWKIVFTRKKRIFGECHHAAKTINMSSVLVGLNSLEEVLQTFLHEMAHALVGPYNGHGPVWQAKARELHIEPIQYWDDKRRNVITAHMYEILCDRCNRLVRKYYRRPKQLRYLHTVCKTRVEVRRIKS